jgi:predicted KAP-like P-loop ATPase
MRKRPVLLHPDAPIVKLEDDALSRVEYAKGIAESIAAYAPTDSVVFGIVGPRGSGKSSLISTIPSGSTNHRL